MLSFLSRQQLWGGGLPLNYLPSPTQALPNTSWIANSGTQNGTWPGILVIHSDLAPGLSLDSILGMSLSSLVWLGLAWHISGIYVPYIISKRCNPHLAPWSPVQFLAYLIFVFLKGSDNHWYQRPLPMTASACQSRQY